MATSDAPIRIGRVALTVNDLATVGDFYQRVVGLRRLSQDGGTMVLGAGDRPLLELREDRAARHRPAEAGLFHTAFLRRAASTWRTGWGWRRRGGWRWTAPRTTGSARPSICATPKATGSRSMPTAPAAPGPGGMARC
ncbi:VOC family protein [Paracoccus mutanolyticus]|uniref:VOC family protein n=1 Tax=Paracoccus mutanolyticus TaxID=1499308 RepID=UPI001CB965A9|nr:VOC family protein [Paracoccus mutanolyticus]